MSVQAALASEYVKKVKKIPESRAINPDTLKTMKELKLKLVNYNTLFKECHDSFENASISKYFSLHSSV